MAKEVVSPWQTMIHSVDSFVFWLTLAGVFVAWLSYIAIPSIPGKLANAFAFIYRLFLNKYGFDWFNDHVLVRGTKALGQFFYRTSDQKLIDGFFVNGTGRTVRWFAVKGQAFQNGYLYHYITVMVLGVLGFLCWLLL